MRIIATAAFPIIAEARAMQNKSGRCEDVGNDIVDVEDVDDDIKDVGKTLTMILNMMKTLTLT